ncbi:MAG: hypothetical protein LBB81_08045 [Treponema sp.]|jgi:hypothetical protein|nr:hypothetical protein [Treponema sp.]
MKNIVKTLMVFVLTAVIVFLMTMCGILIDNSANNNNNDPAHYDGSFRIDSQQVWEGTNSNKISEVYKKFEGGRGISINVYWPIGTDKFNATRILGLGKIEKGLLSCEVPEPKAGDLMEWADFKFEFSAWNNIACVPEAKGNYLRFVTSSDEWLNKEKMSGSSDSVWLESIWYIYVNRDCRITGTPGEGIRPGDTFYKTTENLNLELKRGWNTVCRKQLYQGGLGVETDSMTVINPVDFKWTIRPKHP